MAKKVNKGGRPKKGTRVDFEEVRKLAERGVERDEILDHLEIRELVATDPKISEQLRRVIQKGHADFKVRIAKKLDSEGLLEGKISSLRTLAQNWLPRYDEAAAPDIDEAGICAEIAGIFQTNVTLHREHYAEERCHLETCRTCEALHG